MTATAISRTGQVRLDWRKAGLAATAVGLNAGAIALLSLTDLGTRNTPLRSEPMIVYLDEAWPRLTRAPQAVVDAERGPPALVDRETTSSAPNDSLRPHIPTTASVSPSPSDPQDDTIDPRWQVGRAASASGGPVLSCDGPLICCRWRRDAIATNAGPGVRTCAPSPGRQMRNVMRPSPGTARAVWPRGRRSAPCQPEAIRRANGPIRSPVVKA